MRGIASILRPVLRKVFMASELASELYVDGRVAGDGSPSYVDKVGSVSAVQRDETQLWLGDELLEEQHRRFHNAVDV